MAFLAMTNIPGLAFLSHVPTPIRPIRAGPGLAKHATRPWPCSSPSAPNLQRSLWLMVAPSHAHSHANNRDQAQPQQDPLAIGPENNLQLDTDNQSYQLHSRNPIQPQWERAVATARAITPSRRPNARPNHVDEASNTFQEQQHPLPSGRRTDLMAPRRVGFWALVPYVAAFVVLGAFCYLAVKRFRARQRNLVEDFGEVMVFYADSLDAKRDTVREYKRKLGPGVLRGAMYASYLRNLVTEKPVGPSVIQDAAVVKSLLRISDAKAVTIINAIGPSLKSSPSLLGKLLFVAQRCLKPDALPSLALMTLFPYGEGVVLDLQQNMVDRCFRDLVSRALDDDDEAALPADAARILRLDDRHAQDIFDNVKTARARARAEQTAELDAAESEDASKPAVGDLDYPARSGEPAKAAVHAYQCSQCGYTMFPAAGREFKFFGADFVCPTCGAPKDKFMDMNADE